MALCLVFSGRPITFAAPTSHAAAAGRGGAGSGQGGGASDTGPFAPLNRPGPPLDVPRAQLAVSLTCSADLATSPHTPVLLVPGTTLTPDMNFSWNYERAFAEQGIPYCTVTLPYDAMGDIQVAGEYVVYAIRSMYAEAKRRIDILGFSQGGMVPRWALRFWPDTRKMVDDLVALDPSNHGTVTADGVCLADGCAPAIWQQRDVSNFMRALNSGAETFAGISYTNIYSRTDEVVMPNLNDAGSSSLHTGEGEIANIAVQSVCPADTSDHLAMGTYDPVGYALAFDALTHPGPADPSRIPRSVCTQAVQPGVNPVTFAIDYARYVAHCLFVLATSPHVASEPPLKPYVFASPRGR
ncbi:MAG: lipase [Thermoflavifilum sp.]|nr:lipase [Thermoflavifilum sp.]